MCQSCEALTINGILCHETGCPDSWKDYKNECKECGVKFEPEEKGQEFCSEHCSAMYNGFSCDCDLCICEDLDEEDN
jgi:hypothetical protein